MAEFNNYKIKNSKGVFYLSSKEEKEGYKPTQTPDGTTYYHKEVDRIVGKLQSVKEKEVDFSKGKMTLLEIYIEEDEDVIGVINVPLFQKESASRLSEWAKEFIKYLRTIEKGKTYSIGLNKKKKNRNGYLYKNVFFNTEDGEKVEWGLDPRNAPDWKKNTIEDKVTGHRKTEWDSSEQDKYYYDELKAQLPKFEKKGNNESEQSESTDNQSQDEQSTPTQESETQADDDAEGENLPF